MDLHENDGATEDMFPMTRHVLKGVASAVVLSIVIGAGFALTIPSHATKKSVAHTTTKPVNVIVAKAKKITVPQTITAVGHMQAIRSVDLSFNVGGRLVKIDARDGQTVKKGQAIAQLDDQADLATLKSLKSDYSVKQSKYQRLLKLKSYGGISAQVLEQAKADMVSAEAALQKQQVLINQKTLRAPFAGALGSFTYSVGAYLNQGTSVVKLVQQVPLKVTYTVPAVVRAEIEIGQNVDVTSGAYKDKTFKGIVNFTSPAVNQSSGTLTVEAKIPNSDFLLSPGMFVSVAQILDPDRQLLMVPEIAIMTDINGEYVYVLQQGHVHKIYVKVGIVRAGLSQITSGLKFGAEVVTAGQQRLNDGDAVKVIKTQITQLTSSKSVKKNYPPKKSVVKKS